MAERLAVVTGGGKGIGRACTLRLAELGHRVVALGRDDGALKEVEAAAADLAGSVSWRVCDITDEAQVGDVFAEIGAVEILVNNAGVSSAVPAHKTQLADWEWQLKVNATGVFLCTRAVLPGMRERGWGRIITIASTASLVGVPYTAAYTASKHAALGFTRVVAAENLSKGITANAVCPSFVRTEMTVRSVDNIVKSTGRTTEQAEEALAKQGPLGRLLEPEEIADAVAYLASEGAGAVNGQTLVVDGGQIQH